jgi:hypothetical protein
MKARRSSGRSPSARTKACARPPSSSRALRSFLEARGYRGVPLERNAVGHFQLRGSASGRPALFILDTGASHTVLDRRGLAAFGLKETKTKEKAGGLGTTVQAVSRARAKSLVLGGVEAGPRVVGAIDLSTVNAALTGHRAEAVDGVVGGDLLSAHAAVIDYAGRVLYLRSPRSKVEGRKSADRRP